MSVPELRWMRSALNPTARRAALAVLSTTERERYIATAEPLRETFLAGRLVLRRLAADLTESTPESVQISAVCADCGGPHGRPTLAGSNLHLSLSRTDELVVAAAHWDANVGIDVENVEQPPDRLAAIEALTGERSIQRWRRTEAVLKADGRGLRVDPSLVRFDAEHATVTDRLASYELTEVDLAPDLRVSIAVEV